MCDLDKEFSTYICVPNPRITISATGNYHRVVWTPGYITNSAFVAAEPVENIK
jgi:hypothetical protein